MAAKLKQLQLNEVSLVDRGANQHAHITLFKRDDAVEPNKLIEADKALAKSLSLILADKDDAGRDAALAETFKQYHDHLVALVAPAAPIQPIIKEDDMSAELTKQVEELTKKLAEQERGLALAQKIIAFKDMPQRHQDYSFEKKLSEEDQAAFVAKSEVDRDAQIKAAPVVKAVDPEIAKRDTELADLRKRLEATEEKNAVAEFAKKAVDLGLTEAHGETLRKAYGGDKEAMGKVEQLIKGLTEQVKTGKVFEEFGTNKGTDTTSPKAKVMAKVAEMRKADAALDTDAKAIAKIATDPSQRDLWLEYKAAGAAA